MFLKLIIVLSFLVDLPNTAKCSMQGELVERWAQQISHDLRMLGQAITRYSEIKQKYKHLNAKVGEKNPHKLLQDIKEAVTRMIDRKMDAIECIQREAEKLAENFEFNKTADFEYYSSKWSPAGNATLNVPVSLKPIATMYKRMKLNNDTHFYNLAVDTNHSSVHVPTNIYDKEEAAAFAIQWSEGLDDVFYRNYKSDPALSWQYFGSSSGIMRHYPGKQWEEHRKDLFDCRIRPWFIEAATCTKDVIILVDNSGSMDGMGHHIGSLTASSLLNTFSNNDFINVLNYSATTNYTIPCFENMLVQATRENINMFKEAIDKLEPEGKTSLGQALEVAFDLLEKYRSIRGCVENNTNCNQAIMIITDGVNSNLSDTIMRYNYLHNGTNIPVRLFTYLVGKEVSNIEEIKWISCANRGYYTHVQTLEQVTASVLQYISVVARPLVLQGEDHPISWTHAYVDLTYDDKNDDVVNEPYRLLTSAAIPCYDTKINKMNDTRTAYLLGVAGTDVPLEEFSKLTVPYKIGVNGYAFIVSNNGYVLMHPDLRPVFEGILKDNYNSIDLTQVEQHDDGLPARQIGDTLRELRKALVNAEEGSIHNIKLNYHYDDMKRISEEYFDYYYTPLEKTPFTMCIAVPSTISSVVPNAYGNYTLEVGDEIQKNKHTGENFTAFFNGKWKIHPRWTYCKYHYLEGHEFDSPESELKHFLNKMYREDFKWERQYEGPVSTSRVDCGRKKKDHDRYYCDKQLIQKLIFDAEVTNEFYSSQWQFNDREISLFRKYNASLRFVATMSGLTRWHYIFGTPKADEVKNETKTTKIKEFGDSHPRATNEKWYKSAVLQHLYDPESFVYSVPFDAGQEGDTMVTGSYAIFASDGGKEAPGSVVGFQFPQVILSEKVWDVSNKISSECADCLYCDGSLICYIIDNSGYIIVSMENYNDTGRFFGQVEGDILKSMLEENIFKELTVFDYQALCRKDEYGDSGSSPIFTPFAYIQMAIEWVFLKIMYVLTEMSIYHIFNTITICAQDLDQDSEDTSAKSGGSEYCQGLPRKPRFASVSVSTFKLINSIQAGTKLSLDCKPISSSTTHFEINSDDYNYDSTEDAKDFMIQRKKDDYYACETEITLYVLQQNLFIQENFFGEINRPGVRKYYVKRIPFSNLIFVAIHPPVRITEDKPVFTTDPKRITEKPIFDFYNMNTTLLPCQKLDLNNLPRRRLEGCYNEHILEHEIVDCGKAHPLMELNLILHLLSMCMVLCL